MLCPSQELRRGWKCRIFVSLEAQGRRFHLLDNWGSNKKITRRVPNSGILLSHYTRPAHHSSCSAEAKKLLCRQDMPLATLSLGKYFRCQKIQLCKTSQQPVPSNTTGAVNIFRPMTSGVGGPVSKQTNKPGRSWFLHVTFRCLLPLVTVTPKWRQRASLRNWEDSQNLRASVSTQCMSTKYTRSTRYRSTQYQRRVTDPKYARSSGTEDAVLSTWVTVTQHNSILHKRV